MKTNKKLAGAGKLFLDILEIYIPMLLFLVLFLCFLIGIVYRYFLKNPQSWTFELSSICYLGVGVLAWGVSHRTEEHIVFDMLYNKVSDRIQCLIRVINNLLISLTAACLVIPSINYLKSLEGLKAQTLPIPRFVIFIPFTISFLTAAVRSGYRFALDLKGFVKCDYAQHYAVKEEAQ